MSDGPWTVRDITEACCMFDGPWTVGDIRSMGLAICLTVPGLSGT